MKSEVVIDVQAKEISIALLEDKRLVEFQHEGRSDAFAVGNIYLAKVRKIMPGLNACFVNVGYERDAFLHYLDLGPAYHSFEKYLGQVAANRKKLFPISKASILPELDKDSSVAKVLKQGDQLLVQIQKEPISTKGPRLTGEISFAGRYMVLLPFSNKISVSTKIRSSDERARLKQLLQSIRPRNMGVIVRTAAEGKRVAELDNELKILTSRWEQCISRVWQADKDKLPVLCYEETGRAVALLRDLFNESYENITVNDTAVFEQLRDYVGLIAPQKVNIVKLYKGDIPIFDAFGITRQIKASFGRNVTYKHGAYLIIDHAEALHVIDVNSGNRSKGAENQEENAVDTNLGACDEIARQLRLRDMGGIIVVDFIDMAKAENRQLIYERMVENMANDRAKHNILPLSKFGLMQITRQRVRPAQDISVEEQCPTCRGTGKIKSSLLFTDVLQSKIEILVNMLRVHKFRLHVHPYVAAYINQGVVSMRRRWQLKYGLGIKIIPNQSLGFLQYKFYDAKGEEIDMTEEHESLQ